MKTSPLRNIPGVEAVLQALGSTDLPRPVVVGAVRAEIALIRKAGALVEHAEVINRVRRRLVSIRASRLQPVINGTGILIHTNLGRSPLSPGAVDALSAVARGYCNLEYDLSAGDRGNRAGYLEQNLALLCAAEAATVVNNCAAALVLILRHFTSGPRQEVVISRGELIQIGGGFRIPEILEASGAKLREVGTTNRTTLEDYARALNRETALILKVHRSNFLMEGFVESAPTSALAALARRKRVPLVEDLGSGAVFATEGLGPIGHEPTPAESLRQGVDLVSFSGDKLLGGPQAGLIVGRKRWVAALKREPLFRALRCDKLIFAVLQATVDAHLAGGQGDGPGSLPLRHMLADSCDALRVRVQALVQACAGLPVKASVGEGRAQVGGGTMPGAVIPSVTLDLKPESLSLAEFAARLRAGQPPVVGYITGQRLKIDLRTVFPEQDNRLVPVLRAALLGAEAS